MTEVPRDQVLPGATYRVDVDGRRVYVTVNTQGGMPFEIFIRSDMAELYEWVTLSTILITRLLRAGASLSAIAAEMQEIHSSAATSHFAPGGDLCISLVARIGKVLERHASAAEKADGYLQ